MSCFRCIWVALFLLLSSICTTAVAGTPEPPIPPDETPSRAGKDPVPKNVFTLGEVVVTAPKQTVQGAVSQVDDKALREFNRDDLSQALDLLPGVTVSRVGARNERTVYVRGFDVKHVPLFLDGIPIYVMYDGYSDYGRFTTFDFAKIEVIKGAASVLYGPNTMGGAINVVTKRPEKPFAADAGVGVASGDTTTAYANVGTRQGHWYLQGGVSYVDRNYFNLSGDFKPTAIQDSGRRLNSYLSDKKYNFKIGWQPSGGDEYAFSYCKQEGEKGNPPYVGSDPSEKVRYWQWPQWDKESFYFNSRTALGAESYAKLRLYYDKYDNSLFGYDDATYSTQDRPYAFQSWYNDDTVGGSLEMGTTRVRQNELKAALHYKQDRHKEHDLGEPLQTMRDAYYAAGLEDTITLGERWSIRAGASYEWQIALEAQDYNGSTGMSAFPTHDASAFNPQAGVFYDTSDDSTLYATIARKSRFATLKDRYSYRFGTALPNPWLAPERATNYDLGYKMAAERISLEGAVFFSEVSDYIQSVTIVDPSDPTSSLQQNQNIGEVQLFGAEADAAIRFTRRLDGGLGYTYTDWDNRSNDQKITNIPRHKVNAHVHYVLWDRLGLTAYATHYAGRYSSSNGLRQTDSFTVVDVKAAVRIAGDLKLEGGINNLFDANYEVEEGYPEEGINYFANLTCRF